MTEVLFNPVTKQAVEGFIAKPAHAVMLVGPLGIGKGHVAQYMASKLLKLPRTKLPTHAYYTVVEPEKGSLTIDQVRQAQKLLTLKVPGKQTIRRVILFENAQTMTIEAQNALLKSLEEPPEDTLIIMTTTDDKLLLPTIVSRTQLIQIRPLTDGQLEKLGGNEKQRAIADGRPGLLHALVENEDHPLAEAIDQAKQFLTNAPYDRLLQIQTIKEREEAAVFLQALLIVSSSALRSHVGKASTQAAAWQRRTKRVLEAERQLQQNASLKLLLTDLSLSL